MIAKGDPLSATSARLCREVEVLVTGIICSMLTVDETGTLHPLPSPSLPEFYSSSLDGVKIGPAAGSCGTAAYRGVPVTIVDTASDLL